ncbi:MAG: transglutaminase domain-containing protein [Prevotellaceae bacterium]|jgi:transglutaminase-like putative cysteine protease|nr:transglutaminase domain-containing protein [Prevotellaceae bacterium]
MKYFIYLLGVCGTLLLPFGCSATDESRREQEALDFLYAYMPTGDSVDYSADFYLTNIRAAHRAAREMPWGASVPPQLFRHFVLPVRVNNEALDSARVVFYRELKPRVEGLSMADAILEVNHWCHEKVVYQPGDARTSSPLASVRTAYGRCGEESTFLVAALRAVGIPARQVYTPRWAHTDDNHAWVEAWADGKWYFLGACEPEPVLNLGWFNAPASRGMLMSAKVFGQYDGPEEILSQTAGLTEINVTAHYAPVAKATVTVKDASGNLVSDARVEFKVYNYAEFYTVVSKQTDAQGTCSLTAGKGDMLVWASKAGDFGFCKLTFGEEAELTVVLDKHEGSAFAVDIDIVPPTETANLPAVTPGQRAENDRRMAREDSIRHAYEATMMNAASAAAFVASLGDAFSAEDGKRVAQMLVASRGNHAVLTAFLQHAVETGRQQRAVKLLSLISAKDLRDVSGLVLDDHLHNSPQVSQDYDHVLNPRVANEELTPYKGFFQAQFDPIALGAYRGNPATLWHWCEQNITLDNSRNPQRIPITPIGVWKARRADTHSRDIFFVALARSLGIPAWLDSVTGEVRYINAKDASETQPVTGLLRATYTPTKLLDDPKYETHFTLSRIDDGQLRLQNHYGSWQSLLRKPAATPVGYYLLTTGTRLASGSVLAHLESFTVTPNATTTLPLVMRQDPNLVSVIGSFNSESLFTPVGSSTKQSLLQACGRGYFVVGVLGVGGEPTNHALKDIAALSADLEKWGRKLVLLFPDEKQAAKFRAGDFPGLPNTVIYGIDTDGIGRQIAQGMKLRADALPVFIIADTFNRVVFVSQGYTIGMGDQLMRTVRGL